MAEVGTNAGASVPPLDVTRTDGIVEPRVLKRNRGPKLDAVTTTIVVAVALGAVGVGLVAWFDLSPALAYNDDWLYVFMVQQLVSAHHVRVIPEQTALAGTQMIWATALTLGHPDVRLLRLSEVPFLLVTAFAVGKLGHLLGAHSVWAVVAAASTLAMPVLLAVSTSFMTDTIYLGLLMLALLAMCYWLQGRLSPGWVVAVAALAMFQRQHAAILVPAATIALLLARRRRRITRGDWLALAALWCLVPLVTVISAGIGLQTPTERVVASGLLRIHPAKLMVAMRYAPAVIGLSLIPLAGALVIHRGSLRSGWRLKGFAVAIAAMALVSVALFIREGGPWLPGDYLTAEGLNPWMYRVPGVKAALLPGAVFLAVEVLSVATFVAAVAVSPLRWKRTLFNPAAALLIVVAAGHFLTLMYTGPFDRYFLPVVIPLLPLAAGAVSVAKPSRIAMGWAVGSILLGVALYAAGEQDYEAWQLARSRAANIAYAMAPPAEVNAGYEADALNFEVPYYLANGHMSSPLPTIAATDEVVLRPRRVRLRLSFAPASDPAPGVTYESLAPGKVVIRVVDQ